MDKYCGANPMMIQPAQREVWVEFKAIKKGFLICGNILTAADEVLLLTKAVPLVHAN